MILKEALILGKLKDKIFLEITASAVWLGMHSCVQGLGKLRLSLLQHLGEASSVLPMTVSCETINVHHFPCYILIATIINEWKKDKLKFSKCTIA